MPPGLWGSVTVALVGWGLRETGGQSTHKDSQRWGSASASWTPGRTTWTLHACVLQGPRQNWCRQRGLIWTSYPVSPPPDSITEAHECPGVEGGGGERAV